MKPITKNKMKNGYQSDDDNVRYKLNREYFNNISKPPKSTKKLDNVEADDGVRYMFPTVIAKSQISEKKPKPKIKVNFWSSKQSASRLHNTNTKQDKIKRRHTVGIPSHSSPGTKAKNSGKVQKRVSFLPSPLFSENHVPMLTVPDDLTIHLNEVEANDLGEGLNLAIIENDLCVNNKSGNQSNKKSRTSTTQTSPRGTKRKQSGEDPDNRVHGNENDLEFFSKYVVQKLRKMETNQRIYSENLINTVLMLGQLAKLNSKSKIDA